jgi:hypothetical protein
MSPHSFRLLRRLCWMGDIRLVSVAIGKIARWNRHFQRFSAADATMKDAQFLAEAEKLDLPVAGPVSGLEAEKIITSFYAASPALIARTQAIVGK